MCSAGARLTPPKGPPRSSPPERETGEGGALFLHRGETPASCPRLANERPAALLAMSPPPNPNYPLSG